jgi:hypothetical protein
MTKHINDRILADGDELVCLLCDVQFFHYGPAEPVCPQCGATGPDNLAMASDLEEAENGIVP